MHFTLFARFIFSLIAISMFTKLHAQQSRSVTFQFADGYIYGKNDSLKQSGSVSVSKDTMFFFLKDKASGRESHMPLAITKVEHNKKEDLDLINGQTSNKLGNNLFKFPPCNELLHIYTNDKSDWMFLFADNSPYLVFHNNFVLINFFISSGNYSFLKSLFSDH